jgi:hypothetical protein
MKVLKSTACLTRQGEGKEAHHLYCDSTNNICCPKNKNKFIFGLDCFENKKVFEE